MLLPTEVFNISDLGYRPKVKVKVNILMKDITYGKSRFLTISLDHTIVLNFIMQHFNYTCFVPILCGFLIWGADVVLIIHSIFPAPVVEIGIMDHVVSIIVIRFFHPSLSLSPPGLFELKLT